MVEQFDAGGAFGQLLGAAGAVGERHAAMPGADVAAMYIALAHFAGAVYPDRLDYIDRVLASCHEARMAPGSPARAWDFPAPTPGNCVALRD